MTSAIPDMPMPPMPTKWIVPISVPIAFMPALRCPLEGLQGHSGRAHQQWRRALQQFARPGRPGRCVACGRPTDRARSAALESACGSPAMASICLASSSGVNSVLRDHASTACLGHFASVCSLMIVGRDRQRHQDRRPSRGGQFGNGRRSGPRNDQMRLASRSGMSSI